MTSHLHRRRLFFIWELIFCVLLWDNAWAQIGNPALFLTITAILKLGLWRMEKTIFKKARESLRGGGKASMASIKISSSNRRVQPLPSPPTEGQPSTAPVACKDLIMLSHSPPPHSSTSRPSPASSHILIECCVQLQMWRRVVEKSQTLLNSQETTAIRSCLWR